jgi:hypothetical protein
MSAGITQDCPAGSAATEYHENVTELSAIRVRLIGL